MSSQNILKSDRAYKRGLILGLTMAEIVLLLLFSLLLALAALFMEQERMIEEISSDRDELAERLRNNEDQLQNLMNQLSRTDFSEMRKELVRLEEQDKKIAYILERLKLDPDEDLDEELTNLVERITKIDEISKVLEQGGFPEEPQELADTLERIEDAKDEIETLDDSLEEANRQIETLGDDLEDSRQEILQQEGQIANLKRALERVGKGTEKPACWADEKTGKPKYIYDAGLASKGLIIRHSETPPWAEARELPISEFPYGEIMTKRQFLDKAKPIFQWSEENDCRFFVRAYDLTGPAEKAIYKKHMRYLESVFYKYEVLDDRWE